nr:MAG TPA: hypothetical protein [Caudoviricetes sp.]
MISATIIDGILGIVSMNFSNRPPRLFGRVFYFAKKSKFLYKKC